jgi:hypothetical protein
MDRPSTKLLRTSQPGCNPASNGIPTPSYGLAYLVEV